MRGRKHRNWGGDYHHWSDCGGSDFVFSFLLGVLGVRWRVFAFYIRLSASELFARQCACVLGGVVVCWVVCWGAGCCADVLGRVLV